MKTTKKILAASLAAAMLAGSLTGCSSGGRRSDLEKDYSEVIAAQYGDENIYLDEINFLLRNEQLVYEYYYTMYGMSPWTSEDMVNNLREEILTSALQTRVLCQYAQDHDISLTEDEQKKVTDAVTTYMSEDNAAFRKIAGDNEARITEFYTNNALANKAYYTICSETEIQTTLDDNRQNAVSYFILKEAPAAEDAETEAAADSDETAEVTEAAQTEGATEAGEDQTEGATEAETEAETYYTESQAAELARQLEAGSITLEDAAKTYGDFTAETYDVNGENETEPYKTAASLTKGKAASVYVEGTGWYVLYCTSDNDEAATKEAYDAAVEEEKTKHFEEVYKGLSKKKFKVRDAIVAALDIADTPVYGINDESEAASEAAGGDAEISAPDESEAASTGAAEVTEAATAAAPAGTEAGSTETVTETTKGN
ncbi:MAG: hypothetical protein II627_04240 [Lachnospiraceae bacterium]|nr:hypothetical protein [Lachnospiraceae bacterium]